MTPATPSTRFLASVKNIDEARCVAHSGADIVDCKDPEQGALGAVDVAMIARICAEMPAHIPVSATLGDDAAGASDLSDRIAACVDAGVDFIKIGFESHAPWRQALITAGAYQSNQCRGVGVLLADRGLDFDMIKACAQAGFAGVLLDTADKESAALPELMGAETLRSFIEQAHDVGLFAGLAGALRANDVAKLAPLAPDILGFRGALCHNQQRQGEIDPDAVTNIRQLIASSRANQPLESVEVRPS